jgi:Tfp pilus assembly protein PilF
MKKLFFLSVILALSICSYSQTAIDYFSKGMSKAPINDTGAIVDFTKAIELDPKYIDAYYFRGLYYIKIGEKNKGCLDLSKAGELGLGEAYETIKEYCQ